MVPRPWILGTREHGILQNMNLRTYFEIRRAERLKKRIEQKKIAAMKSGIPQMVNALYHNDVRYYPSWMSNVDHKNHVPAVVTGAEAHHFDGKEQVTLSIEGRIYTLLYDRPNMNLGEGTYTLELFAGETRVFMVRGKLRSITSLEAFIDGPWTKDFKKLYTAIGQMEKLQKEDHEKDSAEMQEMKKNFGM